MSEVKLLRLVTSAKQAVTTLVVGDSDLSLTPEQVRQLREALSTWDEDAPPQPGDPLTFACKRPDGGIVTHFDGGECTWLSIDDVESLDTSCRKHPIFHKRTYIPNVENWDNPEARFPEWDWNLNESD